MENARIAVPEGTVSASIQMPSFEYPVEAYLMPTDGSRGVSINATGQEPRPGLELRLPRAWLLLPLQPKICTLFVFHACNWVNFREVTLGIVGVNIAK